MNQLGYVYSEFDSFRNLKYLNLYGNKLTNLNVYSVPLQYANLDGQQVSTVTVHPQVFHHPTLDELYLNTRYDTKVIIEDYYVDLTPEYIDIRKKTKENTKTTMYFKYCMWMEVICTQGMRKLFLKSLAI
jgi:hypothetical protein